MTLLLGCQLLVTNKIDILLLLNVDHVCRYIRWTISINARALWYADFALRFAIHSSNDLAWVLTRGSGHSLLMYSKQAPGHLPRTGCLPGTLWQYPEKHGHAIHSYYLEGGDFPTCGWFLIPKFLMCTPIENISKALEHVWFSSLEEPAIILTPTHVVQPFWPFDLFLSEAPASFAFFSMIFCCLLTALKSWTTRAERGRKRVRERRGWGEGERGKSRIWYYRWFST